MYIVMCCVCTSVQQSTCRKLFGLNLQCYLKQSCRLASLPCTCSAFASARMPNRGLESKLHIESGYNIQHWTQMIKPTNGNITNLNSENKLPTFWLNAPVIIRAKLKDMQANIAIYSHVLLTIYIIGGQRSAKIAPPYLPPHHSGQKKNKKKQDRSSMI